MKTREDIVFDAFRKLGIPGDGDSLSNDQLTAGIRAYNSMINTFQAKHGLPLWKRDNYTYSMALLSTGSASIGKNLSLHTPSDPVRILGAWRVSTSGNIPLTRYSHSQFTDIPTPTQTGTPVIFNTSEKTSSQVISLWPLPTTDIQTTYSLLVTVLTKFNVAATDTSSPEFPDHWEEAIIYGLSVRLAPEYGIALDRGNELKKEAKEYLDIALNEDNEDGSIFFSPRMK